VDRHKDGQGYFQLGLTIGFLSRLYMATGKKEYLNLAKEHFEFMDGCEGVYASTLAHKNAWACANLFAATGEGRFLEAAKKVADHLVSVQKEDGRFHAAQHNVKFEDQTLTDNLDTLSQFTTWIAATRAFLVEN